MSLATDLGMGQPMENAARTCVLAVRIGEQLGLDEPALTDVYYVALLRWAGCTGDAHELAAWFGDEIAARARAATMDFGRPLEVIGDVLRHAGEGRSAPQRIATAGRAVAGGRRAIGEFFRASCEVAQLLADRLGFESSVRAALGQVFERWDGGGWPEGVRHDDLTVAARVVQVAQDAQVFQRLGGVDAAAATARRRSGFHYDPRVAEAFARRADLLLARLDEEAAWDSMLATEPGGRPVLSTEEIDSALRVMADFVDLKSPFTAGHSTGVAELAAEAAHAGGLPRGDVEAVRRAGLLHDLGRTGVPNGIWEKEGRLSDLEWERVRLHSYLTERVLARPKSLTRLAVAAAFHHERLDGSGYHRGLPAGMLSPDARILAAADAYHAMVEPRPHRPALTPDGAADELRTEVTAGRLDGGAVNLVLRAAGHRVRRRRGWPSGLTPREVDVVRLLARGLTNRGIAAALHISERTAAHHVQHIYEKLGVSTRAGAAVFAMQHDLVEPDGGG